MKIAVAANGPGKAAQATPIFGRAPYFVIVDVEGNDVSEIESVQNPGAYQQRGAGIAAAQLLASRGVDAVVAGNVGPNAYTVLSQAGIKMLIARPGTVEENALAAARGELAPVAPAAGAGFGYGRGFGGAGRGWGRGMGRGFGRGGGFGRGWW